MASEKQHDLMRSRTAFDAWWEKPDQQALYAKHTHGRMLCQVAWEQAWQEMWELQQKENKVLRELADGANDLMREWRKQAGDVVLAMLKFSEHWDVFCEFMRELEANEDV